MSFILLIALAASVVGMIGYGYVRANNGLTKHMKYFLYLAGTGVVTSIILLVMRLT